MQVQACQMSQAAQAVRQSCQLPAVPQAQSLKALQSTDALWQARQ